MQNVINIFCTLLRRDFPLPELLYAIYQLLPVAWLDFRFQVELEFMPQVFDWVEVRTLWRSTPPVNVFLLKEGLCSPGRVFGIVVLHEPVVGKFVSDKWHERRLKYVAEEISIHDAIKDTNLSGTMAANPPPDMNFEWVLRFRLSLGGLVRHPEACTAIRLEGNRALIAKNYVVESVSTLQNTFCELQPLDFVSIPNQLAIGGPLQSPALLLSRSPVRCSFLIMRVMPERLTTKPSPFKVFNIPAGWRPWVMEELDSSSHVVRIFRHDYHLVLRSK